MLSSSKTEQHEGSQPTLSGFPVASEINALVPEFPLRRTTFSNLTVSWPSTASWMRGEVPESDWDHLILHLHSMIPHGGGFLKVDDPQLSLLPPPLIISWPEQPTVYSISVFHQLHCFTAILNDFNRIQNGQPPIQPMRHLLHCFDFIKQAILCCGDCTSEPHQEDRHGNHLQAGMDTLRVCKDFDKILSYANAHAPKRIK
ncbi:Oxidase ustYa [Colletotrichum higginsianum]|nr:Oxidase ustYa [Colletotrichum higginsianum]